MMHGLSQIAEGAKSVVGVGISAVTKAVDPLIHRGGGAQPTQLVGLTASDLPCAFSDNALPVFNKGRLTARLADNSEAFVDYHVAPSKASAPDAPMLVVSYVFVPDAARESGIAKDIVKSFFTFAQRVNATVTFTPEARTYFLSQVAPDIEAAGVWRIDRPSATCTLATQIFA